MGLRPPHLAFLRYLGQLRAETTVSSRTFRFRLPHRLQVTAMNSAISSPRFALGTFSVAGCTPFVGLVLNEQVIALSALGSVLARSGAASLAQSATTLDVLADWPSAFQALAIAAAAIAAGEVPEAALVPVASLRVHAPVAPRQVFCAGANYKKHVVDYMVDMNVPELRHLETREEKFAYAVKAVDERAVHGRPYLFIKLPSCLTGPYDSINLPADVKQADWEVELAAVIGRPARHVKAADALNYVAGYTIANDTSARELLFREDFKAMGTDWLACKSTPAWAPLGPYLVPSAFIADPHGLRLQLKLNGEIKQDATTNDMVFNINRQIEFLSHHVQLLPGDVICTGSPAGNGSHYKRFLQPGDVVECFIDQLGTQRNVCAAEKI